MATIKLAFRVRPFNPREKELDDQNKNIFQEKNTGIKEKEKEVDINIKKELEISINEKKTETDLKEEINIIKGNTLVNISFRVRPFLRNEMFNQQKIINRINSKSFQITDHVFYSYI